MRKLRADEIECRVAQVSSNGFSLLLYKTARVDRAILDEMYTACGWQNDFKVIDGKMYGGIAVRTIDDNGNHDWVWKWDCGTESNTEAEKGQASDCFKRAGFKWGIGVELYTAPFIFISGNTEKDESASKKAGKDIYRLVNKYKKYSVAEISYSNNGDISKLTIVDENGETVYPANKKNKTNNSTNPKPNNDQKIIESLTACTTVSDIELIWKKYNASVENKTAFTTACKKRKEEILKETNNG